MPRDCHSVSPNETEGLATSASFAALSQMERAGQDQILKRDGEDGWTTPLETKRMQLQSGERSRTT
jgi:hypothetical protein